MSDLIPNKEWEKIRKLSYEEISNLKCCEIVNGEDHRIFGVFLMVPQNEYIKAVIDAHGQLSNATYPEPETDIELTVITETETNSAYATVETIIVEDKNLINATDTIKYNADEEVITEIRPKLKTKTRAKGKKK